MSGRVVVFVVRIRPVRVEIIPASLRHNAEVHLEGLCGSRNRDDQADAMNILQPMDRAVFEVAAQHTMRVRNGNDYC